MPLTACIFLCFCSLNVEGFCFDLLISERLHCHSSTSTRTFEVRYLLNKISKDLFFICGFEFVLGRNACVMHNRYLRRFREFSSQSNEEKYLHLFHKYYIFCSTELRLRLVLVRLLVVFFDNIFKLTATST